MRTEDVAEALVKELGPVDLTDVIVKILNRMFSTDADATLEILLNRMDVDDVANWIADNTEYVVFRKSDVVRKKDPVNLLREVLRA